MTLLPVQQSYIGGRYVPSTTGEGCAGINPATGEVLCRVEQARIGRENGLVTLEHCTQFKSVYVEMGDVACPY